MNNDTEQELNEILRSIKQWLQPTSRDSLAAVSIADVPLEPPVTALDPLLDYLEELDSTPTQSPELAAGGQDPQEVLDSSGSSMVYKSNWGEIPTVQKRFQAILKQRIQAEIDDRLPLFPWETSISDYELEELAAITPLASSPAPNYLTTLKQWLPQLNTLNYPQLPETVLAQVLQGCLTVVNTPRKLGSQIVKAVGELFPEEGQSLNDVAGLVLAGGFPGRGASTTAIPEVVDYEAATLDQQMAWSLLAARQIINTLTLSVSAAQPQLHRQWQTSYGNIDLQLSYQTSQDRSRRGVNPSLRVQVWLPRGGKMILDNPHDSVVAERAYPGYLSAELFDLQPNQLYPLEIRLLEGEQTPLNFVISVKND
jgi:hypothetical protein